jgi:hypothetical protein
MALNNKINAHWRTIFIGFTLGERHMQASGNSGLRLIESKKIGPFVMIAVQNIPCRCSPFFDGS